VPGRAGRRSGNALAMQTARALASAMADGMIEPTNVRVIVDTEALKAPPPSHCLLCDAPGVCHGRWHVW